MLIDARKQARRKRSSSALSSSSIIMVTGSDSDQPARRTRQRRLEVLDHAAEDVEDLLEQPRTRPRAAANREL